MIQPAQCMFHIATWAENYFAKHYNSEKFHSPEKYTESIKNNPETKLKHYFPLDEIIRDKSIGSLTNKDKLRSMVIIFDISGYHRMGIANKKDIFNCESSEYIILPNTITKDDFKLIRNQIKYIQTYRSIYDFDFCWKFYYLQDYIKNHFHEVRSLEEFIKEKKERIENKGKN